MSKYVIVVIIKKYIVFNKKKIDKYFSIKNLFMLCKTPSWCI